MTTHVSVVGRLYAASATPGKLHCFIRTIVLFLLLASPISLLAQSSILPADIEEAERLAKLHKDDEVACMYSKHLFTFGKGENNFKDKVVTVEEESEQQFLSLKKQSSIVYPEYYNQFVKVYSMRANGKFGKKYNSAYFCRISRESVTDENIFYDDNKVRYAQFRFPELGRGGQVLVKKEYSDAKYLTRVFFQRSYPVLEHIFEFKVPEWLTVDFKTFNFDGNKVQKEQEQKGGYTIYRFTMRNIPARKSEFKQISSAYTEPHIVIQVKSFERKGETLKGFDKVDDVYQWNNRLYKMAKNEPDQLKSTLQKIIAGKTTDNDKIKAIYYWVQDKIRYIAYEDGYSGFIPANAQDVLKGKYGDCKGMANLLTEFLKLAGYDAHFTWIGTRQIPYSQTLPALCVNNHAIATLYLNGKEYFLDATEKYVPFGENAYRIQGKEALIERGSKFEIKTVPLTTGLDHKIHTKADLQLNDGVLKGTVNVTLTGNERKDFHQIYQELATVDREEFLKDYLEFSNDNLDASGVTTSDLTNRDLTVNIKGNIDLTNNVHTISGDQFLNIDFFPKTLEGYFPDEKRQNGYDFDYVLSFEDEFVLTIPANKKVSGTPDKLELKQDGYEFTGEYIVSGNKVTLKKLLVLKKSSIIKKDFENWKNFLTAIKKFNRYYFSITKN